MEEKRPNPDALLRAIKAEDARNKPGQLRIFFGMAAGVGKTYAMLKAAQQRFLEGVDVVVGVVETHARAETEALLQGLPTVERKKIGYRGTEFEELDLDAILKRRPQLVLVDELAHSNVPGARHGKRWHDVAELLDNGIDVYTTLNVQHIESRKDAVESIAGVAIRETVPDSIVERAAEISLIDLTPMELLQRLREGKVYLGDRADRAVANFFTEERLTALREVALRLTAEKVDNELQQLVVSRLPEGYWKATERLMVAVSHSPYSAGLIRATRRLAFSLEAPWIAVNVDTGKKLSVADQEMLTHNLALARELGAEVISTADTDIVAALQRIARQRRVTQMVVGRPTRQWMKDILVGGTLLDRLVRRSGDFDVHVLRPEKLPGRANWGWRLRLPEISASSYWWTIGSVIAIALLSSLLEPFLGYRAVGFLLLLTVLTLSLFFSLGPILLAALFSAVIWDFFFIPPYGTLTISQPEDMIMCVAYFVAAIVTGTLTHRIRRRELMLRRREVRTEALYEIVRTIVGARDKQEMIQTVCERLGTALNGECRVLFKGADGLLVDGGDGDLNGASSQKELAVLNWTFENRKVAGWSTDTLPEAGVLCVPLLGPSEIVGVLAYHPQNRALLSQEDQNLLSAVCHQLSVAIEREHLREISRLAERLEESEKLHQTILDSVSHEIRTPLTAIIGAASALADENISNEPRVRGEISRELIETALRLDRVVNNLLDMSRLSTGALTLNRDWHDVQDLISLTLTELGDTLSKHKLEVSLPTDLPLLQIDLQLFVQVLTNIILNAASYSPARSTILVTANLRGADVELSVSDQGNGVQYDLLPHIFDKFYRVPGSEAGGTGLGLAVAKSIVEMHGGKIEAHNRPEGGLRIEIRLPVDQQPELPKESES